MTGKPYDSSWDSEEDVDGEAFDRKYEEWESREWVSWLKANLKFPFRARREEDSYLDMFAPEELHARNPFPQGCEVEVVGIAEGDFEPDFDGVIMDVHGDKRHGCEAGEGCLPLQDL
jgi:hypothetical protein